MARITFAFGTSHGPILTLPPAQWPRSRTADMMEIPVIDHDGRRWTYDELLAERRSPYFEQQASPEGQRAAGERRSAALDELSRRVRAAGLDVLVVIGDDHYEMFKKDIQPSFAVYCGASVVNRGFDPEGDHPFDPAIATIKAGQSPRADIALPVAQGLAMQIIGEATAADIDLTVMQEQTVDAQGLRGIGHFVGFVYHRLLDDAPLPLVPVLMNTYFPPNQPPVRRCLALGRAIGRAVQAWGDDLKVGIVGSGGLSHFAVDEALDRRVLEAFRTRDLDSLLAIPEALFRSGTSEIKNWITMLGAIEHTGLQMDLIDYVPCYRSPAGTGAGTAFATWS